MQLKQLEVFVQVARYKSFSKAAEALFLTQPTVSAHLAALEDDLAVKLVTRSTRSVSLTPAGEALYRHATQILGLCNQAKREVRAVYAEVAGTLSIAASTVPAQYLLPKVLSALREQYPQVFFQIRQGDSGQVTRMMLESGAELGIVGAPVRQPGLECTPFLSEHLTVITPNRPEYQALGGVMPPERLRAAPMLVREAGSGTRKHAEAFLREIGLDPRTLNFAAQMESTESIIRGVQSGLGIAIVSGLAAEEAISSESALAFEFDSPLLERHFYLLHHKNRPLSPAAAMLLEYLPCYYQNQ